MTPFLISRKPFFYPHSESKPPHWNPQPPSPSSTADVRSAHALPGATFAKQPLLVVLTLPVHSEWYETAQAEQRGLSLRQATGISWERNTTSQAHGFSESHKKIRRLYAPRAPRNHLQLATELGVHPSEKGRAHTSPSPTRPRASAVVWVSCPLPCVGSGRAELPQARSPASSNFPPSRPSGFCSRPPTPNDRHNYNPAEPCSLSATPARPSARWSCGPRLWWAFWPQDPIPKVLCKHWPGAPSAMMVRQHQAWPLATILMVMDGKHSLRIWRDISPQDISCYPRPALHPSNNDGEQQV